MSMLMRAAICGLKGAGSASGSPYGMVCAAARSDKRAKAAIAANTIGGSFNFRMELLFSLLTFVAGGQAQRILCSRLAVAPISSTLRSPQVFCRVHSVSTGIFGSLLADERLTTRICL